MCIRDSYRSDFGEDIPQTTDVQKSRLSLGRSVLSGGDSAIAALLLNEPTKAIDQSLPDVIP